VIKDLKDLHKKRLEMQGYRVQAINAESNYMRREFNQRARHIEREIEDFRDEMQNELF